MRNVLLASVALVLSVGSSAAQTHTNQASASIQATATVVQSLGVTSPEDNLLRVSTSTDPDVVDVPVNEISRHALSLHRMLVRYPSDGSVVISIESDAGTIQNFPLESAMEPSQPGAVVLDLDDIDRNLVASGSDCVLTLIYSEN